MGSNYEKLYELVQQRAALVRRGGLRDALGRIDPALRDRRHAGNAIAAIYSIGCERKLEAKDGVELNHAEFIVSEAIDAAYKLDMQLPRRELVAA